jgi:hypothetical protein
LCAALSLRNAHLAKDPDEIRQILGIWKSGARAITESLLAQFPVRKPGWTLLRFIFQGTRSLSPTRQFAG